MADLSWYASYIFLYLLIRLVAPPHSGTRLRFLPWLAPVFTFAMAVFYMQWADYASNLIYASLMGLLMFASIRRLLDRERYRAQAEDVIATSNAVIKPLDVELPTDDF